MSTLDSNTDKYVPESGDFVRYFPDLNNKNEFYLAQFVILDPSQKNTKLISLKQSNN